MSETNPFEAPQAENITGESSLSYDDEDAVLSALKFGSTWKLVGLSIVTLGIFDAHYMHFQARRLNQFLDDGETISLSLTSIILGFSYLTVIALLVFIFGDIFEIIQSTKTIADIEKASDLIDSIGSLLAIIWAFKARNRMNMLHRFRKSTSKHWFHGFWTFVLQNWYFNWKVNQIIEDRALNSARRGRRRARQS